MPLQTSCTLWNRLENTVSDIGPNGIVSGGEAFVSGRYSNAIEIDADTEYLGFDGPSVITNVDEFVVEWWMKPYYNIVNGTASDKQHGTVTVLANYNVWERGCIYFYIQAANGTICLFRNAADTAYLGVAGMMNINNYSVPANTWVHMAIVRSNSEVFDGTKTMAFYVDGIQKASDTENGSAKSVAGKKIFFGAYGGLAGQNGNCLIDNVKIHNDPSKILTIIANRNNERWPSKKLVDGFGSNLLGQSAMVA